MKIGIVGCGAVGGFYGARLARAGQTVHFLLRSDYEVVRRNGVLIRSPEGDFTVRPICARDPREIGVCDLVIVALKTTANDRFPQLLPRLVGAQTAVLTLQNGLGSEESLARLFPVEQIMGGLCFVCLNRIEPGTIVHTAHGLVVLGEWQRPPEPRTREIASLFRLAGISCQVTDDLARAHWEKLVWNIPFNGLGVAGVAGFDPMVADLEPSDLRVCGPCLTTDILLADSGWAGLVRELMLEVVGAAHALGFDVPTSVVDRQIERTRTMGAYKASTLVDFERGQPVELENLFLEPLCRARAAGAIVPRLERLCQILKRLGERAVRS